MSHPYVTGTFVEVLWPDGIGAGGYSINRDIVRYGVAD